MAKVDRLTVRLDENVADRLERVSTNTGLTRSQLVTLALRRFLAPGVEQLLADVFARPLLTPVPDKPDEPAVHPSRCTHPMANRSKGTCFACGEPMR